MAALAQRADQGRADALVVLHHQELGHGATLTPTTALLAAPDPIGG